MSALGQKQTLDCRPSMSAIPPKANIRQRDGNVRFVPIADIIPLNRSPRTMQDWGCQFDVGCRAFSVCVALIHIPFIFIATDEKVRMSRLAIIFPVVAWYFFEKIAG